MAEHSKLKLRRRSDPFESPYRMPLGFKLWFGFIGAMLLTILSLVGYLLWTIGTDPAVIGRFLRAAVDGFTGGA